MNDRQREREGELGVLVSEVSGKRMQKEIKHSERW